MSKQREFWHDGYPNKTYSSEWFIAKLKNGEKAVLRALPEEFTYDFKTADDTYFKKDWVVKWAQFPDSNFVPFDSEIPALYKEAFNEMLEALKFYAEQLSPSAYSIETKELLIDRGKRARAAIAKAEGRSNG